MISNSQIKIIKSLRQKKFRVLHNQFIAEGDKTIIELIKSNYKLCNLFSVNPKVGGVTNELTQITPIELKKISNLSNPKDSIAVFEIPQANIINYSSVIIGLDNISDPGNLGTIIRLCDWFGIQDLICSLDTVDCYNPKVVQASMGSLSRVNISYINLESVIKNNKLPVYGTYMDGESVYKKALIEKGIILFGNEANGISLELSKCINHKISIPRFGDLQKTESLNVANTVAIVLSDNSRKSIER